MKSKRIPQKLVRPVAMTAAALLLSLLLTGIAAAQGDGDSGDTYLDPLAFTRVNAGAEAVPLTVKYQATGETRRAMGRQLLADSQEMYLRSASLATILKAGRYWQGELRHLDLKVGTQSFRVTAGSRVVVSADGEMLLPVPVLDHDGDLWLPMVFLEKVVGPQTRERVAWDAEAGQLSLGSADYSVARLEVEVLGRTTAVHVYCREPLGYRTSSPRSGVIDLKIYGGEVNTGAVRSSNRRGLTQTVSSRQHRDHATVTISVDQLVGRYRTYTADEGREIVVVLEEEQVSTMPEPVPRGHASVNIEQGPVDVTNRIDVQTVVVDPGHGGHDVGAVSRRGIIEKDVNLGVAKELRRYLERESDLKVVLTRDNDSYLELNDRAEIANSSDGDLFLSLHCNSWFNDGAHGLETYFLSPAQSDWAKSVAAAENQAGRPAGTDGDSGDVEFIVWELVQNRFISSSSMLAETIQNEVTRDLGMPNRGVRQAGFRVLVGAYMPAVLIELGFLSHNREEQKLGDRSYHRELAQAIGDAILSYRRQIGSGGEVADD
ncbi:MAG: N-acetylmuramoyl-L-alanine amidase [Candidatus Krumholzibacteriota bacterium]